MQSIRLLVVGSLLLLVSLSASAADAPVAINVYPPDVNLTYLRDRQSVIVQVVLASGITKDVTDSAKYTLANAKLATVKKNVLHPTANGKTQLIVQYGKFSKNLPVLVKDAKKDLPVSFKLDVMPVFMKAGCNVGSCHGAARGKDGFRLSLFGFDPDGDYYRLTREISGRRINLALPMQSLMMEKVCGKVPHTGGKRMSEDSELALTLKRWLVAGAPRDKGVVPKVTALEIYPRGAVLNGKGVNQRLNVRAKYADGSDRDVTTLAFFMSNNDNSATVKQDGIVSAENRGEAFMMSRFSTFTEGTQFIILPKDLKFQWNDKVAEYNYIDKLMNDKFRKLRINPSKVCTDEEFLRRATLDVAGVLPTVAEFDKFVANKDPKKRAKLVDELLSRKEFVEIWVMKWSELLQIRSSQRVSYKAMLRYYNWLQEKIANNEPMDKMVQELLGSNGGTFANAATNYYQTETATLKVSENVAQVFMGMRIQCAQCHNHPFDRWTMDDYYSFAAFFSQIGRKGGEDPRETIIFNSGGGQVKHPVGGRVMQPKFLGGRSPKTAGKDRRVLMANWLASSENPYFATNLANIVWAHFFGKGIIDPVDDVRISNPAVNRELLTELGKRFTDYKYNFKRLVRDICTSRTYQLSTTTNKTNASDTTNFSHASLRRLRAEVLLDTISQVTKTNNKFRGLPVGARAVQIADGNTSTYFLKTFGRAERGSVCSCEVKIEPNLSQALHLLNGQTLHQKIRSGGLILARLKEKRAPGKIVEELYIRTISRKPGPKELDNILGIVKEQKNMQQGLEDVFWALLNSREFLFNH